MCKKGEGHKCPKCGLRWGNEVCMNGTCCVSGKARTFYGRTLECGPCNGGEWLWGRSRAGYIVGRQLHDDGFTAWVLLKRQKHANSTK